jgi:hypothetical protein
MSCPFAIRALRERLRSAWLATALVLVPLTAVTPPAAALSQDRGLAVPTGTASLSGVAVITINGQVSPVRRARVVVQTESGAPHTTDTDTRGNFAVSHLAAGGYHIVIDKPGFVPIGHAPVIDIRDGQAATARVVMQRGAAIEGRLVSEDGEPAMGLTVSAVRLGYGPYGKKVIAVRQTTTDDLGRFRVHTLLPGDYYIEAAPDPLRMLSVAAPENTPRPARTYYAGTSRVNDAQEVTLTAGQQVSGLDFTVTSAAMSTVIGRVTTASGQPPSGFSVRVQRVGAPAGEVRCVLGSRAPNDNSFQCPNIPPGDFWFLVAARAAPDADVEYAVTRVTVDSRDLPNVPFVTAAGVPVSGRVEVDGGGPLPANVQVAALETEYEFPAPTPGVANSSATPPVTVGVDGAFTFTSLAGPRLLRLDRLPEGWAVKGVWLNDAEISDAPTSFGTEGPRVVRVVVTPHTGSVSGTVVTAASQPAAGTRVVVFTDDVRRWAARSRYIQTVEVGAAGHYVIRGLLPGKYFVAVVDALDDGAWEDSDVLARLRTAAASIVVTGTEELTLDWRLK